MIKKTGYSGFLQFPNIREWRIESLHMHGIANYFWNWCVKKHGYKTFYTDHNNPFSKKVNVILKPGESSECPATKAIYTNIE